MEEMDTGEMPNIGSFKVQKEGQTGTDLSELFDKMQIAVVGREDKDTMSDEGAIESSESDGEFGDEVKYFQEDPNMISQRHQKHTDLEERAKEDMDFPDEVDTPLTEARVRFQKYRGIKSLKNCDWDPYENLPESYSKIWRF